MNNSRSRARSCEPAHKSIYLKFLLNFYEYFLVYVEHLRNKSPLPDRSRYNNVKSSHQNFSSNVQRAISMFNVRKRKIETCSQMYNHQSTHYNRADAVNRLENELNCYASTLNQSFISDMFVFKSS